MELALADVAPALERSILEICCLARDGSVAASLGRGHLGDTALPPVADSLLEKLLGKCCLWKLSVGENWLFDDGAVGGWMATDV